MRRLAWLAMVTALLAGCGSGGMGGSVEKTESGTPAIQKTESGTPTLEIKARGASGATVLNGVEVTVRLPPGVTVAADPTTGEVNGDVLSPKATGAGVSGRYLPATADLPARLTINIASANGFTVGTLLTIRCLKDPGAVLTRWDFTIKDQEFIAWDQNGARLTGISPDLDFYLQ